MRGVDFVQQFASRGAAAWEAAALSEAKQGTHVPWALVPVTSTVMIDGAPRSLVFRVARDYFAVGDERDPLRMPLTPLTAQKIADVFGMFLPTPKMVKLIHEQASTKLEPTPMRPNAYADLRQYAAHNQVVQAELAGGQGLVSGIKKDVVIGNQARPNKVLIYGWMEPEVPPGKDLSPMMTAPWRVQPYSSVHGTDYVDYSHGIRFVAPDAVLDGKPVKLADVLVDPKLSVLVSDEGPLKSVRYNVPKGNTDPVPYIPGAPRLVDQGLAWIQEQVLERED